MGGTDYVPDVSVDCKNGHGCAPAIRTGSWKLVLGWPGKDELIELPAPSGKPVPYGNDKGMGRDGNQAIGPHWKGYTKTAQSTCGEDTKPCLYNLDADPAEHNNIADEHPDIVASLTSQLHDAAQEAGPLGDIVPKNEYKKLLLPVVCQ